MSDEMRYRKHNPELPPGRSLHDRPIAFDAPCPHGLIEHYEVGSGWDEAWSCPLCDDADSEAR